MPSTYTTSLRLNKQATGENSNVWGNNLNTGVIDLLDFASDGTVTISASGATTLTTANGTTDQARGRILNYTGTSAGTLTIPSVSKWYWVRAATSAVTVTNGGSSATVEAGEIVAIVTNGTTIWKALANDFGGNRVKNIGAPTENTDAATKKYVDDTAFASTELPGQTGNAGKFVKTDGTTASWETIEVSDVNGLQDDLDDKANQATTYTKTEADNLLAAKAPLNSPALTGTPTAPTAASGTSNNQIATTAFVQTNGAVKAWGVYNPANSSTMAASFNIASVSKLGTGEYRFTFTTNMPSTNYAIVATASSALATGVVCNIPLAGVLNSRFDTQVVTPGGTPVDADRFYFAVLSL